MQADIQVAEDLFYAATQALHAGEAARAEAMYRQCLARAPGMAEAHANLAYLLAQRQSFAAAEQHYQAALELAPGAEQVLLNYGCMLTTCRRFSEAESCFRQVLAQDASICPAWVNLGVLYACQQRDEAAEQCYRHVLAQQPEHANALFNLAYILLRQGRFAEGWRCFEARAWYRGLAGLLPCPRWQAESLAGKSILVGVEAGHGDMLQFCRYLPRLKALGAAHVAVLCHPGLKRLFSRLPGCDRAIALDEPLPAVRWDYWVPMLSLPFHFQTSLETIPAAIPYLSAEPALVDAWATRMPLAPGLRKVGLAWRGNPRFENDAERSLPDLSVLAPLWSVPGVQFYSLQKEAGEDELRCAGEDVPLVHLAAEIDDFADTAAIMMQLDLVISVDTAVAHLAGALGRPCWVLLPDYKPDWRWLQGRTDSPWYPGVMHLFRQVPGGGWSQTVAVLREALMAWAGNLP